ncbi:hypothetical protein [Lysobacter sp. A03]|uniref:hypothetical protein n=1 Tax=Lysobacter sp. A03 TaxID=1199154 RepID=UPI001269F2AE|nr:hypothetical protein [Lysobacter sp. A03]
MQTDLFLEELEAELAQFTDGQVDSMLSSTETDVRYRAELLVLYAFAVAVPTSVLLIGVYLLQLFHASGALRFIYLAVIIACVFGATRLFNMASAKYVRWRYRSSLLRQLASVKAAGER